MHKNVKYKSGFTLVELAIVLLVISAILGFVLGGRDLMRSAENSSIIADITYYSTARKQFEKTYGYLPGDVASNYINGSKPFGDASLGMNHAAAPVNVCPGTNPFGDGKWDELVKQDLAWIQLSYAQMIEQHVDFDPCPLTGTMPRMPGTHRPHTKFSNQAGLTFLESAQVIDPNAATHTFIKILRIGIPDSSGTDTNLSGGALTAKSLREVDRKIDQPETPASGRIFTDAGCMELDGSDIVYKPDADKTVCTLNFADFDVGTHAWIP